MEDCGLLPDFLGRVFFLGGGRGEGWGVVVDCFGWMLCWSLLVIVGFCRFFRRDGLFELIGYCGIL